MSAPGALFKHSKRRNNLIKKLNISISDALITHIFIKSYFLKPLKSAPGALVNISQIQLRSIKGLEHSIS